MKRYKYFYAKTLNWQNYCIVSKPRILKGEVIQVLLRQQIWIVKAIVLFQTPDFLKMKRYKYFFAKKFESTKRFYRFKPQKLLAMKRYNYFCYYFCLKWLYERHISQITSCLKGTLAREFITFSMEIWAPHKVVKLEKKLKNLVLLSL